MILDFHPGPVGPPALSHARGLLLLPSKKRPQPPSLVPPSFHDPKQTHCFLPISCDVVLVNGIPGHPVHQNSGVLDFSLPLIPPSLRTPHNQSSGTLFYPSSFLRALPALCPALTALVGPASVTCATAGAPSWLLASGLPLSFIAHATPRNTCVQTTSPLPYLQSSAVSFCMRVNHKCFSMSPSQPWSPLFPSCMTYSNHSYSFP